MLQMNLITQNELCEELGWEVFGGLNRELSWEVESEVESEVEREVEREVGWVLYWEVYSDLGAKIRADFLQSKISRV